MTQWEYKVIHSDDVPGEGLFKGARSREAVEAYLNKLGAEGWEVVSFGPLHLEGKMNFVGVAKREKR
jgi:hypothetical protein